MVHPGAWILGEGLKSGMRVWGWCLKIRTRKREMGREPPKLTEKLENVRIVLNYSIHINLSPHHCCFVVL